MAKKKKPKTNQDQQPEMGSFFDPRAMEQLMKDLSRLLGEQEFKSEEDVNQFLQEQLASGMPIPTMPDTQPRSDLERAQNLIYEAYEARTTGKKISLARKALNMSLDCADGYVLLAEYSAKTAAESIALFEEGVRAGKRALGDEFDELKGHFWGFLETRPYMRARLGLAMTLWNAGRLDDAAGHMNGMLELNPNDNQGVRHVYITLLLELDDVKRLEKLLISR